MEASGVTSKALATNTRFSAGAAAMEGLPSPPRPVGKSEPTKGTTLLPTMATMGLKRGGGGDGFCVTQNSLCGREYVCGGRRDTHVKEDRRQRHPGIG